MPRTASHQLAEDTDLLALVLQHVPQQERLQSCALTCRSWRAAANQATSSIRCSTDGEPQLQTSYRIAWSLPGWLSAHGRGVSRLQIDLGYSNCWQVHLRLPLQQLHQLQHLHLSLHGSNVYSGSNPLVPLSGNPTALVLRDCTLQTSYCSLAAVTALTGLRRLQLAGAALTPCCRCRRTNIV